MNGCFGQRNSSRGPTTRCVRFLEWWAIPTNDPFSVRSRNGQGVHLSKYERPRFGGLALLKAPTSGVADEAEDQAALSLPPPITLPPHESRTGSTGGFLGSCPSSDVMTSPLGALSRRTRLDALPQCHEIPKNPVSARGPHSPHVPPLFRKHLLRSMRVQEINPLEDRSIPVTFSTGRVRDWRRRNARAGLPPRRIRSCTGHTGRGGASR